MIKAIETSYKNYRFRSRTEARWAVWLDAMGIGWRYEHEGYNLGEYGNYLPDFVISLPCGHGTFQEDTVITGYKEVFFEVKPETESEINHQHEALAKLTKKDLLCVYGVPNYGKYGVILYTEYGMYEKVTDSHLHFATGRRDERELALSSDYESITLNALNDNERWPLENSDLINGAYTKAMAARFEFGERP
jgi:hypothetical protein